MKLIIVDTVQYVSVVAVQKGLIQIIKHITLRYVASSLPVPYGTVPVRGYGTVRYGPVVNKISKNMKKSKTCQFIILLLLKRFRHGTVRYGTELPYIR